MSSLACPHRSWIGTGIIVVTLNSNSSYEEEGYMSYEEEDTCPHRRYRNNSCNSKQ
jgi:hypothetical protein